MASNYQRWTARLKNQLVRCANGNYEKILEVDGFSDPYLIHIKTVEGHAFWCRRDTTGRLVEVPNKKDEA
jgi:hypothetical protein